jgi:DNA uptake protein ComE-like DNA-binding protein
MRQISGITIVASLVLAHTGWAQVGRNQGIIDLNVATPAELERLPGISPAIAKDVVARRPFLSILALDSLLATKLSAEQRTTLYGKAFIHVNLNTGSREEIMLIPGAGRRMAGEFIEYRPYTGGLPQFRREIGKYVDSAEVARLEQYVFVPVGLNRATDEAILSIPGIGARMLREFKEYRPYRDMAQFRREIGKYVDAKELARLERYVSLD